MVTATVALLTVFFAIGSISPLLLTDGLEDSKLSVGTTVTAEVELVPAVADLARR